jgi:hypothetical protein
MTTPTSQPVERSKVIKLESRKINRTDKKEKRAKRARLLRSRIVRACDDMHREFPRIDVLVLMRNRWQSSGKNKSQHWIHNSIQTEEDQWDLNLKDFVGS